MSFSELLDSMEDETPVTNWTREHIGFLKNMATGQCLDLQGIGLLQRNASVTLAECDYEDESSNLRWVVDVKSGFIRNLNTNGHCLDVVGHPGWKNGSPLDVAPCNYNEDADAATDQRWKFDAKGFIVNRLSGHCISPANATAGLPMHIDHCEFGSKTTHQTFQFVGLSQVAALHALASGRPQKAVTAEDARRHAIKQGGAALLVLDDVARVSDPTVLLDGRFFEEIFELFHKLSPQWDEWTKLGKVFSMLSQAGPVQKGFGIVYILGFLSNMVFAGTNFVYGFERSDLSFMQGFFNLTLKDFVGAEPEFGCHSGPEYISYCMWQQPVVGEKVGVTNFQDFIKTHYGAHLPAHTFFESIFMGDKTPSWEDDAGHKASFSITDAGISAVRQNNVEPMQVVKDMTGPRFAFDTEGLTRVLEAGFGWLKANEVKYASNGAHGTAVLERLMQKYEGSQDVLGMLLTDTVLSMHLTYDDALMTFIVDNTALEKYQPIKGYAKLGGKALLQQRSGRLVTIQLEYDGKVYKEQDFQDNHTQADFSLRSKLSGWRFAEKAIIASLWAKTQLLVHVKTIHLELAPALQAVTVDSFADSPSHPLRRLLDPFTHRSIQATKTNLRVWFEYRAGEFALAPLPMEEQLKLIHETMHELPLNLADLDMTRYAQVRGMSQFSRPPAAMGSAPGTAWSWRWHYRASKVQEALEELVACWLNEHYQGNDQELAKDQYLQTWWTSLQAHMPALRTAAEHSPDWLTSAKTTAPPSTTLAATAAPISYGGSSDFAPVMQQAPKTVATQQTTKAATTTTAAPTQAPQPATTSKGFFSVMAVHDEAQPKETLGGMVLPDKASTTPPVPSVAPTQAAQVAATTVSVSDLWRRLQEKAPVQSAAVPVNTESLRRVLVTLMLWGSWIHEDVGHSAAALLYDPVNAPPFVPADGVGIPLVPWAVTSSVYRDFVFVERAKLTDPAPKWMFDKKECHSLLFLKDCNEPKNDKKCFASFQGALQSLSNETAFSECDKSGFYSCMDRVEISASS